jgi:hypothetical protein
LRGRENGDRIKKVERKDEEKGEKSKVEMVGGGGERRLRLGWREKKNQRKLFYRNRGSRQPVTAK